MDFARFLHFAKITLFFSVSRAVGGMPWLDVTPNELVEESVFANPSDDDDPGNADSIQSARNTDPDVDDT